MLHRHVFTVTQNKLALERAFCIFTLKWQLEFGGKGLDDRFYFHIVQLWLLEIARL